MKLMPSLNREKLIGLQKMLHKCNPYVKNFRTIADTYGTNLNDFQIVIKSDLQKQDVRRYNKPTASDIAVIISGDGRETVGPKDVQIN